MPGDVVKVLRPAPTNLGAALPWVAYDGARQHLVTFEPPTAVIQAMGADLKAYFEAVWVEDHWVFGVRTRPQAW